MIQPSYIARCGARYLRGSARLSRLLGVRPKQVHRFVAEFRELKPFPSGFHPLKHTDQYKAAILYALCRHLRPSVVVETGVASGTSSVGILMALEGNGHGHLDSIDLPGATYRIDNGREWTDSLDGKETGWLVPPALKERWSLHFGPSSDVLPKVLAQVGSVDLFYHDSEHTAANMTFEFEAVLEHLSNNGVMVSDNINWNHAFSEFCALRGFDFRTLFPFLGVAVQPNRTE